MVGGGGVSAWSHCFRNGLLTVILQSRIPKPEEGTLGFVQSFGTSGTQRSARLMSLTEYLLNTVCIRIEGYYSIHNI